VKNIARLRSQATGNAHQRRRILGRDARVSAFGQRLEKQNGQILFRPYVFIKQKRMNTRLTAKTSVGTFGFRMCRREHHEITEVARRRQFNLSGLIRGLLREWRAQQKPAQEVSGHGS
jgi:hypothetical protein